MKGKPKGVFPKGKYGHPQSFHIKARRDKGGTTFDVTIRFTEKDAREILRPQVEKFIRQLDKEARKREAASRSSRRS
jgi:hypothetical protein